MRQFIATLVKNIRLARSRSEPIGLADETEDEQ